MRDCFYIAKSLFVRRYRLRFNPLSLPVVWFLCFLIYTGYIVYHPQTDIMPHSARILLADDDMEDRMIIEDAFRDIGLEHEIAFVEDGEYVVQFLDDVNGEGNLPSLIVLDLNMPRLNGTETLRLLKNHPVYRNIPVKIFSTSVNEIEKEQCLQLGADAYVIKPVKYEQCIAIARDFYDFCSTDAMSA